ncbi:uncharacterized protein LOC135847739 isoform X5 [Planococcus citri]|uniref:uncharacterized protein LOC135847739 isoform X5 n=1 Tax=Planococcus citri TaxID=170843 RepID=UPI0031F89855
MEVGQSQDLEMTEAAPKVYDILHPTPVSLKELSAMAISLKIWRHEVNEYRTSRQLKEFEIFRLRLENTQIELPDLPSMIHKMIRKFFNKFANSVFSWIREHYQRVPFDSYGHENYILQYFEDFVCDYDGSIHYTRTAERMMRCVGFSAELKFKIACLYFFEEDIRRIWPSVSRQLSVDFIDFRKFPQLYYWICRLTNELYKIPTSTYTWRIDTRTVDERMFDTHMSYNRPSFEYFWNRISVDKQMNRVEYIDQYDFARFILPKLNDRQLNELFNKKYGRAFYSLFRYLHCSKKTVLRIWFYIRSKNIMNKSTFNDLVVNLIEDEDYGRDEFDHENWEYLCREIWKDTPLDFKQSTISFISSDSAWLDAIDIEEDHHSNQIHVEFLLLILQDASLKERNSFWHNCWEKMIEAVRTEDLQRMMRLCLKNEDEINQFKENYMNNSPVVLQVCLSLFTEAYFEELNAFVSFCCPELQSARNFKEQILRSVFLDEDEDSQLSREIVCGKKEFNNFVRDVSADFKKELVSSPSFLERLSSIICDKGIPSKKLAKFIRIFVSTKKAFRRVKTSLIDSLKEYLATDEIDLDELFRKPEFNSILLWCLGSNEAVGEFKLTCTSS